MSNLRTFLAAVALATFGIAQAHAAGTPMEMRGNVAYQTLNNGTQVRINVETLVNTSQTQVSGTLHLILFATTGPSPIGQGYTLADSNLGTFLPDTGRIQPTRGVSNLVTTTDFQLPPNGTYYVHLIVAEFPDLGTILDSRTFSSLLTVGGGGNPPPPPPPPGVDDHGNTAGTSSALTNGVSMNGRIDTVGDVDMFRIQVSQRSRIDAFTEGSSDTIGRLYDAAGNLLAENDDVAGRPDPANLNFGIGIEVAAGTYYVAVSGFSGMTGAYRVRANVTPANGGSTPPVVPPPVEEIEEDSEEGGGGASSLPFVLGLALVALARRRRNGLEVTHTSN